MKHIKICNLGPIKEADIELKRINVIIGPQSLGKSCVLKTACYCTWVEKRIELTQSANHFAKDNNFLRELEQFHKLQGYIKTNTFISYESDFMSFSYDNTSKKFTFMWTKDRWKYRRTKVTYIPAERNLVAVIPNWFEVKFANDNIRDFMADWETARKATLKDLEILNLGVTYHYDPDSMSDKVQVAEGVTLDFTNTSSGLQSLIPLFTHLNYLSIYQNRGIVNTSITGRNEEKKLWESIHYHFIPIFGKIIDVTPEIKNSGSMVIAEIEGKKYSLEASGIKKMQDILLQYLVTDHCDIFLEEPEENLFPPTQSNLVEWLLETTRREHHPSSLFVATHSPYILNAFLEKPSEDINMFIVKKDNDIVFVKTLKDEDIQEIYDYGMDAFFNIESLG